MFKSPTPLRTEKIKHTVTAPVWIVYHGHEEMVSSWRRYYRVLHHSRTKTSFHTQLPIGATEQTSSEPRLTGAKHRPVFSSNRHLFRERRLTWRPAARQSQRCQRDRLNGATETVSVVSRDHYDDVNKTLRWRQRVSKCCDVPLGLYRHQSVHSLTEVITSPL